MISYRRNLVARMQAVRDQHDRDEKKLLDDIRELDRLLERNHASKSFMLKKSNMRQEYVRLNELFAGKRKYWQRYSYFVGKRFNLRLERSAKCLYS